ncbi:hypothetical protein J3F83DRAFT_748721 [Trichoderma novae-zelandiae]
MRSVPSTLFLFLASSFCPCFSSSSFPGPSFSHIPALYTYFFFISIFLCSSAFFCRFFFLGNYSRPMKKHAPQGKCVTGIIAHPFFFNAMPRVVLDPPFRQFYARMRMSLPSACSGV